MLGSLSFVGGPALGQTPAPETASSPDAVSGPPSLRVVVQAVSAGLDPYAVQRAVEAELGVVVRADAHPDVVGTLNVVATGPDALTMEYVGNDGRRNSRTVKLPASASKRIETVALVAGNLARDETGQLIEELRPPPPPAPEASATPAAPEAASAPPAAAEPPSGPQLRPAAEPRADETPPTNVDSDAAGEPELEQAPVNLSLFTPIALYPNSAELEIAVDLGLVYSDVGRIGGGSLTWLVSRVRHGYRGVRVAGLVNLTKGSARGVAMSGFGAFQQGDLTGASLSGAANYSEGNLEGGEVAGFFSYRRGHVTGGQLSGAFNAAHDVTGAEVAGAVNWAHSVTGVQLSGAANVARSANGLMLAGAANYTEESASGVQLAPVNVAQSVAGLQFGVVNVARRVRGLQFGVVNVAEEVDGASVGLVPIAGNGYQRFVAWSTPGLAAVNAAGKFGVGPFYSLVGVGFDRVDGEERVLPAFGMGLQWELEPVQLSFDGMYQSSHPTPEKGEQEFYVSARPLVAVRVQPWLRLFGGPAFVAGPHDGNGWNQEIKVRAAFGVEVFR